VPLVVRLIRVPSNPEDPALPVDIQLLAGSIQTLVPGGIVVGSNTVTIPASVQPGTYNLTFEVGHEGVFPESASALANNTSSAALNIVSNAPSIVRVCATANAEGPPTVASVFAAVQLVAPDGTVRVCDGVHAVFDVNLNAKSLTIAGEGPGTPTLDAGEHNQVFFMNSSVPVTTSATLRKLRLRGGRFANITVHNHYGSLLIDQVEFVPPLGIPVPEQDGRGYAAGLSAVNTNGGGITIQRSSFVDGDIGLHLHVATKVVLNNNQFDRQRNAAIHVFGESDFVATNNSISNCSRHWCIGFFEAGNTGSSKLLNNTLVVGFTNNTIQLHQGVHEVRGNTILGVSGARNPDLPTTWPINNALHITNNASAVVSSNNISGAYTAMQIVGSEVSGTNNAVNGVRNGLLVYLTHRVSISRSDFGNYVRAIDTDVSGWTATCNYWGSAGGPSGVAPWIDRAIYTPWASSPIAHWPTVVCEP
jgi:hypothetical protein